MDQVSDLLKQKKNFAGLIIILIMLVGIPLSLYLVRQTQIFKPKAAVGPNISRPATPVYKSSRGTVTSVAGTLLTIQTESGPATFSMANTNDFQRITSGTIETDNVVTVPATKTEVTVNKEVLVIWDRTTNNARAVYIIR